MKTIALFLGIAFLLLGAACFVPGIAANGTLFGILPGDAMMGAIYLITGIAGVAIGLSGRRTPQPLAGPRGPDLRDFH